MIHSQQNVKLNINYDDFFLNSVIQMVIYGKAKHKTLQQTVSNSTANTIPFYNIV
jgi:hypothetical protein